MERFASLGILTSEDKIREVFYELVLDDEKDGGIELYEDYLTQMLDYDGQVRAGFIFLEAPYQESLASNDFANQLAELSVEKAKGISAEIISSSEFDTPEIENIMKAISEHAAEGVDIAVGTKQVVTQNNAVVLFMIAAGIA